MVVELERRMMSLFIVTADKMYHRLVFAEMAEARARELVREYGYDPKGVYAVVHEKIVFRHEVDDSEVAAVLERMPYHECRSMEEVLAAVRCIVPQAVRIGRMRGYEKR